MFELNCPDCGYKLTINQIDNRQEYCDIYYNCENCKKEYIRTITYKTQSSMVASDELFDENYNKIE